ncbi:hypothetical protein BN1708_020562, partial [Verticillium longisporum]
HADPRAPRLPAQHGLRHLPQRIPARCVPGRARAPEPGLGRLSRRGARVGRPRDGGPGRAPRQGHAH